MSHAAVLKLVVVSDYICPWCYIGLTRVERLQQEYEVDVEWMPHQLRPHTPPEGIPFDRLRGTGPYTGDYFIRVTALAAHAGIDMKERKLVPNSLPSLEAAEWARDKGGFPELHRAMFGAYFEGGQDIGDTRVLHRITAQLGLDADDLVLALETRRYTERLEEKLEWSRIAGGPGVPHFIFRGVDPETGETRRSGFTGAQDYEVFRTVAERLGARKRQPS
jgi:predicted DsbA family dithiol-disulfide isomerase